MPDLAACGGVLEMKKIAAMADAHLIPVAPHNMVGPVATIASMHLCLATPNFLCSSTSLATSSGSTS